MAVFADIRHHTLLDTLAAPFHAATSVLTLLVESRGRLEQVERLSRLSDEQLAARGTTREDEIRRIFGVRAAL